MGFVDATQDALAQAETGFNATLTSGENLFGSLVNTYDRLRGRITTITQPSEANLPTPQPDIVGSDEPVQVLQSGLSKNDAMGLGLIVIVGVLVVTGAFK